MRLPLARAFGALLLTLALGAQASPAHDAQHWLGLTGDGWQLQSESDDQISWAVPGRTSVVLRVIPRHPDDVPASADPVVTRDFFRRMALEMKGGLVEVRQQAGPPPGHDLVTMKFPLSLFKADAPSRAWAYQLNALFVRPDAVVAVHVAAIESTPTGVREALAEVYAQNSAPASAAFGQASRRHDPYDAAHDGGALYCDADARTFDSLVPDHPLTRVRRLMEALERQWAAAPPAPGAPGR